MVFIPVSVSLTCVCKGLHGPAVLPDVVPFTVRLPVPDEARAGLVQVLAALGTFQTGSVPLQVGGHPQDILVVDLVPATHAKRHQPLLWKDTSRTDDTSVRNRCTHLMGRRMAQLTELVLW